MMTIQNDNTADVQVMIADSPALIEAAQKVRYQVFYDEYGATPNDEMARKRMDFDKYDVMTDHLVVVDRRQSENLGVVGTYRLLRANKLHEGHDFYTADEFDIHRLKESGADLLELGRSCVLPEYRTRPVLQLLWEGIAQYLAEHKIDLMFGCASFNGTDVSKIERELSYLYHYHLASDSLRARALDDLYVDMNILPKNEISHNMKRVFANLPPLIKGYIRLGASIGEGAIIDHNFNTIDVCIILPTHLVTERYLKHYQRKTHGQMPTDSQFARDMRAHENT
ncbi:MAG: GNAT family N-acyltransferase [Pseudomonadota bacterium]|nr:hemolysin-like protein [Alphaproteobacteria bacterium]MCS5596457.1 GNAT family N-acetyltransferase [Alphaproteobacteria bacterium]MEC7703460.1 GNAT family N-acyltransferase [Pseudomonadota bacterium]MEC9236634.1 GNAT family N-acyltransferase [Pseudomonadota bacterium]|tara:strand:- start:4590 stop:5435 length:846 start_codon:yes stop_codon:yes gene_type:complete